ncbi:ligase-associated DNA damage response endonuclease PdeM [Oricola thermophila]|uniref:Ligase-associated DNA damage response endonuclease PdeM n=1 Tax=Oricola thermophila TaxID=2742145 RepID=A0A6N1VED9_9HYPH|nr:ligase-associated DNA damage response endonuclease PdeM [Oricola thermophila]QKV19331.1 ligase-associated DNA damage response endonuclease PdeM [Oricola thermophila]
MDAVTKRARGEGAGEAFALDYAGGELLLDPAGVAWFPRDRILVVSDLHLEKGSSFARNRIYLPPYDTPATLARLARVVDRYAPATIVSLGDSFHDDEASARLTAEAVDTIATIARGRDMIWVTGNHDPSPPANVPGRPVDMLAFGRIVFRHVPNPAESGHEICGHLHPCARIAGRGRTVRRPCFASDGTRLVMPAFGAFTGGLNVRDDAFAGLFDQSRFRAYMLGNERIYPVGPGRLRGG